MHKSVDEIQGAARGIFPLYWGPGIMPATKGPARHATQAKKIKREF